jgi:hypothetical protein
MFIKKNNQQHNRNPSNKSNENNHVSSSQNSLNYQQDFQTFNNNYKDNFNNITNNSIKLSARDSLNLVIDNSPINMNKINIPPIYPQSTKNSNSKLINNNYITNKKSLKNSKKENVDFHNLSGEKILSPKSNFKFQNEFLSRSKSSEKLKKDVTYNRRVLNNDSSKTLDVNFSSVELYLRRRHTEAQNKLQRLKHENLKKEEEELRDRPKISKNSKRIVENLVKSSCNVVERLTSKAHNRKKSEKLNQLEEVNNKMREKPKINATSEKLQRTIDDLYYWQKDLNTKKENIKQKQNQVNIYLF